MPGNNYLLLILVDFGWSLGMIIVYGKEREQRACVGGERTETEKQKQREEIDRQADRDRRNNNYTLL